MWPNGQRCGCGDRHEKLTAKAAKQGMVEPIGFVPTEWMPMSMAFVPSGRAEALCGHCERQGNRAQQLSQRQTEELKQRQFNGRLPTSQRCSMARWPRWIRARWKRICRCGLRVVLESNRMKAAQEKIAFAGGAQDRIKHVIYIIKENRTYDQILGDLSKDGKPVGNGDPS